MRARISQSRYIIFWLFFIINGARGTHDSQGPAFLVEPPPKIEFTNVAGGRVDCVARGNPLPFVSWFSADNSQVKVIPPLRHISENGSMVFPPFEADLFRQDVHWTTYRCLASNAVGTIASRDVIVRAVVQQRFDPEVESQVVHANGNVLLRCMVPSFVKDHVSITSWLQEPSYNIYPSTISDGKYHMVPSGELIIINITSEDTHVNYKCRTHHRLAQEVAVSPNPGRIRFSESKRKADPAFPKKLVSSVVRADEVVVIPCVAEGNPPPSYRWFRKHASQERLVNETDRTSIRDGTLMISHAKEEDAGTYHCQASNDVGSDVMELQLAVSLPLTVHIHPPLQTLQLNTNTQLECNIHGFPKNSITWMKDGQHVRYGSRVRLLTDKILQIFSSTKDDKGMYQCFVKNDHDMSQGTAEIQLGEMSPQLAYRFIEQTMQPGPSVSLKCSASGNPTPHITWTLDGYPLPPSDRLLIGQYVTLFGDVISHVNISSVKAEDAGEYECSAENRAGQSKHAARLNIYGLPFVRKMSPVTAVSERTLVIKCPISGYPVESVTWEKDGVRLPVTLRQRVENNSLIVENVQRDSDQGSYTCSVRNKQGHHSQGTVSVQVVVPPKLTPFSFPRDLKLGDRISVQCLVVSGDEPLRFVWLKDGQIPADVDDLTIRTIDPYTSSLSISAISRRSSGNYTCRSSNQVATVTHTATLYVNVSPRISPFYFDEKVTTGMRTEIMCSASSGDLPINISWTKDGNWLKNIEDVRIDERSQYSSILTITKVTPRHSGNYTCKISNAAGQVQRSATLSVTVPPYWLEEPIREQNVILGNPVVLHCRADGFPKPTITWKIATGPKIRSNQVQPSVEEFRELGYSTANMVKMENGSLTILRTSEADEGFYMCAANNGVGAGKSTFIKLMVHAGPRFAQRNRQETVRKGETIHLQCEAEGDQPIDITWKIRGNKIDTSFDVRHAIRNTTLPHGVMSELTIMEAGHRDKGSYLCVATNAYGQDHSTIMLLVQEPPSFPKNLHITEQSSRSIRLSWSTPSPLGDPKVDSYYIQYKEATDDWHEHSPHLIVSGDKTVAVLGDLKPATMYHFRIYAQNQLGISGPSDVLHSVTDGEAPTGAPQQVTVQALSSTEVLITWQPPDKSTWNGELTGFNIGYKKLGPVISNSGFNWTHVLQTSGSYEYRLEGLAMFTKYSLVITARNNKGDGPMSDPIVVQTKEGVPRASPEDIHCSPMSAQSLQIAWRPPPLSLTHGIIQGYRVIYTPSEDWYETSSRETKVTQSLTTIIHGLRPYTNYSLQILAFTRAGDGIKSPILYCATDEAVPDPPAAVKALISGKNIVTISWLPPREPNGLITSYIIHIRKLLQTSQLKSLKVSASTLHHRVEILDGELCEAWVSATNKVGQGHNTHTVQLVPSVSVPAGIISFGREITVAWKSPVHLPCHYVGQSNVRVEWRYAGIAITKPTKMKILDDKTLVINSIERNNEGNYSCHVRNEIGSDFIIHSIKVQVPPTAPLLLATAITSESVLLQWKQGDNGGSAIRGFLLSYKEDDGQLKTIMLEENASTHLVEHLKCGTYYQFALTPFNKIGSGAPSKWISIATKGSRPVAPSRTHFLTVNATSVTLHLGTWGDGGCMLSHFALDYKHQGGSWIKVSDNLQPLREYILQNLLPGSEYVLKVGAFNNAGAAEQEYALLTLPHLSNPTLHNSATFDDNSQSNFSASSQLIMVGISSVLSLIIIVIGVCFCINRRSVSRQVVTSNTLSSATLENKHNQAQREHFYSTVRKPSHNRYLEAGTLERIPEHAEDIHPYATFHLPERENVSANKDPSSFLCESGVDDYSDQYTVQSGRKKSKGSKSESEEYDSLGSESEIELNTTCHQFSEHSPLKQHKRRRHMRHEDPRLFRPMVTSAHPSHHNSQIHEAESTTSSETSPTSNRRSWHQDSIKKKHSFNDRDRNSRCHNEASLEALKGTTGTGLLSTFGKEYKSDAEFDQLRLQKLLKFPGDFTIAV